MTQTYTQSQNVDPTKAALGEQSAGVSALQTYLNSKGAGLTADSKYGPLTQAAVAKHGLPSTAPVSTDPATDPLGGVRRYTGNVTVNPLAAAKKTAVDNLNTTPVDQADINKKVAEEMQDRIDSINNVYTGIIASEKNAGVGRLGRTRATSARGGTLGSDFGNTDLANTETFNKEKVLALENERASQIADVMSKIQSRQDEKVKAAKEEYFKNTEAKLAYMKDNQDKAKEDVKTLASTGTDLNKLTQEEYNALIEQTGMTDKELQAMFVLNRPVQTIIDKKVVGSKYYQVSQDPITKKIKSETIDLGFSVPEDYTIHTTPDGTILFSPKQIDPSKPIGDQVLMYGKEGQFSKPTAAVTGKPFISGEAKFMPEQISAFSDELEKARTIVGSDGKKYVDQKTYNEAQQAWTDAKGLAKDFQAKYPPAKYVQPVKASGRQLPGQ